MITENLSTLKIHKLTQAQYERELNAGNIDETALYLTPYENVDFGEYVTKDQVESLSSEVVDHETRLSALESSMGSIISVHSGADDPDSSLGEDGDIYLVTEG